MRPLRATFGRSRATVAGDAARSWPRAGSAAATPAAASVPSSSLLCMVRPPCGSERPILRGQVGGREARRGRPALPGPIDRGHSQTARRAIRRAAAAAVASGGRSIRVPLRWVTRTSRPLRRPVRGPHSSAAFSAQGSATPMQQCFPNGIETYLVGGLLIGAAVSFAFAMSGLVTGMSTVFSSTWSFVSRLAVLPAGSIRVEPRLAPCARRWARARRRAVPRRPSRTARRFKRRCPGWRLAVGGFIAGFGARLSNGCTSGHGICGIGSFQPPSLLAVVTFLATAIVTAQLVAALGGA